MENKCQKYNIIQMLKSTLFSHIFKNVPFKMYLPCGVSPSLLFHKKIILASFIVSLLVYISQMYLLV